jgi:hypothetical protein
MADDKEVAVKISAQTDDLVAGLQKAGLSLENFSKDALALNPALAAAFKNAGAAAEQAAAPSTKLRAAIGEAFNETNKLNFATAGATQEYIRLGHEALTGNFSRIPGSLIVLGSRLGALEGIITSITPEMIGFGATIGIIVGGTIDWAINTERMATAQIHLKNAMDLSGVSASYNKDQIDKQIVGLRLLGDMSTETAEKVLLIGESAHNMSQQLKNELLSILPDFAAKTNQEAPKAMAELVKLFEDPKKGATELAETLNGVLSAAQLNSIQDSIKAGNTIAAQAAMFDALAKNVGSAAQELNAWDKAMKDIHTGYVALMNPRISTSLMGGAKVDPLSGQTSDQVNAAKQQQDQQADNQQELASLAIANEVKGQQTEINQLLEKQEGLTKGIATAQKDAALALASGNEAEVKAQNELAQKLIQARTDVEQKITKIHQQESKERINISMQEVDEEVKGLEKQVTQNAEYLQAQVDLHQITKQQETALESAFVVTHYQMMIQDKENELNILGLTVEERKKINDQIVDLQTDLQTKLLRLKVQEAQAEEQADQQQVEKYRQILDQVGGGFDSVVKGVLQGTQTWKQAFGKLYDDIGIMTFELVAKITAEFAGLKIAQAMNLPNIANAIGGKGTTLGALTGADSGAAGGATNTAQTAAITTNTGALTTLNANITTMLASMGVNTTAISTAATQTAAGTAATTANTATTNSGLLATIEANLATAKNTIATEANSIWLQIKSSLPSFAVGSWNIPTDMNATIHQGEMIIPAAQAAQIRSGAASVGGGSTGGGNAINFSVNAVDAQSITNLFKSNGAAIANVINNQVRNNNTSLLNAIRN